MKRGFTFVLLGRYIPLGTARDGLIIMVVHVYKSWSRAQSAHCGCPGALVGGASVSSNSLQARGAAIKCSSLKAAHFFFFSLLFATHWPEPITGPNTRRPGSDTCQRELMTAVTPDCFLFTSCAVSCPYGVTIVANCRQLLMFSARRSCPDKPVLLRKILSVL